MSSKTAKKSKAPTRSAKPAKRKASGQISEGMRGHWVTKEELTLVREKLQEAQETLDAIRSGEVDAVVVSGPNGSQVYSLSNVERPYRVYVERMQEGAATISAEGLVLYCNQRFADMLHAPLERVIGSRASQFLSKNTLSVILRVCRDDGEEVVKHEGMLHIAGDEALPVHFTASRLPLDDAIVVCLVVTDLTLQREQEKLRMAKEVAERASLAKDSFLAALSHELRTPLTPALMSLMALEHDDALPEFARTEVSMIRRNIELETRLIDDLLDLTRIASGKLELHAAPLDIHTVLSRAVEICRLSIEAKQHRLGVRLKARETRSVGDAVRLQQVLWNILRNAIKFTPNGGAVTVATANLPDDRIQIEVSDSGIGFEPGAEKKLFLAFEQSGRAITQQFGGLGLGLAISRSIIEAHGGSIYAQSDGPGTGATFTVILPLHGESAAAPRPRAAKPAADSARKLSILVVEDHPDTRATLQRLLERRGHRIVAAASGQEAIKTAEADRFDLVISDLGLPDMTGNELMSRLRDCHGLVGIAVSGYGMEDDVSRSFKAGFLRHLTKPIVLDQLNDLIGQIVSASGGKSGN